MMLNLIAQDIWEYNHPLKLAGMDIGHRMTVIRLKKNELFIHSPAPLDDTLINELKSLGRVSAVIAPSRMHDLFLIPYFKSYPQAQFYCAPGLAEEHPQLPFTAELSLAKNYFWNEEIQQLIIHGMPKVNEVVFLHRSSSSLIVADLVFNLGRDNSLLTNGYLFLAGAYRKTTPSRLFKLLIKDKQAMKLSIEIMLLWDFDRLIMGHGDIVNTSAKDALRKAYAWLL